MSDVLEFIDCVDEKEEKKEYNFERIIKVLDRHHITFSISNNRLFFNIRNVQFTIIHEYGTTYTIIVEDKLYGRYAKTTGSLEIGFCFLLDTEIDGYERYFSGSDSGKPYSDLWKPHPHKTGHWNYWSREYWER